MKDQETLYGGFLVIAREIAYFQAANNILEWDMETYMPPAAAETRAKVIAHITGTVHDLVVSDRYEDALGPLVELVERGDIVGYRAAAIRKAHRDFLREIKLPGDFVRELADLTASSHHVWVRAKKESDFSRFLPNLKRIVEMKRREACIVGFEESPYDALLAPYDPGTTSAMVTSVFSPLRDFLKGFIAKIGSTPVSARPDHTIARIAVPTDKQRLLVRGVADRIGFDLDAGRIDPTEHPFCATLHHGDVRLTTNYKKDDFLDSLYSTIHEAGHGIFEQNLPAEFKGTPVGESPSYGFHESQSRMYENLVGRSREFWRFFLPRFQYQQVSDLSGVGVEDLYRAVNAVTPSLIRIEADEVTYNLHICLRFEIEKALIEGKIEAEELPEIWNKKMMEYLGLSVPDDGHGVLQDVHWSSGLFGYFPSYALGNLYAAQIFDAAVRDIPGLQEGFARGEFLPLLEWLRDRVYRHGGAFDAPDLVKVATGQAPDATFFTEYVERKFGEIYGI